MDVEDRVDFSASKFAITENEELKKPRKSSQMDQFAGIGCRNKQQITNDRNAKPKGEGGPKRIGVSKYDDNWIEGLLQKRSPW